MENERRKLKDVLNQIIPLVPKEEPLYQELLRRKESIDFAAPEVEPLWWFLVAETLEDNVTEFVEEWQKDILKIWTNKP